MLKYGSLDTGERCPKGDLVVGDAVLPTDAKDFSALRFLGPLQTFDVSKMKCSGLASVLKGGEDNGPEGHW